MENDTKKVAVVGTGAAGLGALTALLDKKENLEIVVYDIGREILTSASVSDNPSKDEIVSFYNGIYERIYNKYSFKFPPPKTHFSDQIPRLPVGKKLNIFKSESLGGLTNYWGSTMLPFTDREMDEWPIKKEDLYPYYERIAKVVGLSAGSNELDEYFNRHFSTRPEMKATPMLDKLDKVVNRHQDNDNFKIVSGLNRCGLETRKDKENSCVYCGECLSGCFQGSIYSTQNTVKEYLKDPRVRYVRGKVKKINKQGDLLEIETEDNKKSGFSKVFLCAGCPSSTEIVMRSLNFKDELVMADNAVYVFPILYSGFKSLHSEKYLSLCNLIFSCIPKNENDRFAQVQVYPNFDYLWRYNIPPYIWPVIKPFLKLFRSRIFWGRLYVHSDHSQAYSLKLENDELVLNEAKQAKSDKYIKSLISDIRDSVNHNGFYIPPISPVRQKVNSHYAATIPFNGDKIKVSELGEVMPGVHLCDSSVFPDSPAVNPAFTSMANGCRVADKALN